LKTPLFSLEVKFSEMSETAAKMRAILLTGKPETREAVSQSLSF
jgi:hypothetical protein